MSVGFFPVENYRQSTVTNGGTTVQDITRTIDENRTVTDTKNLTNLTTRNLTETIQADIGSNVKFRITNTNKTPIPIPSPQPVNPNTT